MVTTASPTDRLHRGDAALAVAVAHLPEAIDAFWALSRADLAAPVRAVVTAARQAELLRRVAPGPAARGDPADCSWTTDGGRRGRTTPPDIARRPRGRVPRWVHARHPARGPRRGREHSPFANGADPLKEIPSGPARAAYTPRTRYLTLPLCQRLT
jgi:hypothetical protein